MNRHVPLLAALLSGPALAGGGGGGLILQGAWYPRFGDTAQDYDAPGGLGCIGGVGFGFANNGLRLGGEGISCRGRPGVSQGSGGLHLGFHQAGRFLFWGANMGLGFGSLVDKTPSTGRYQSLFLYTKPTFTFGFGWGASAIEFGVYSMMPVNLVQWVHEGDSRGIVHAEGGLQVSFLFGRMTKPRVVQYQRWPTDAQEAPPAIPGPPEPPPPPQSDEGLPLAIPADEVPGYPPPPPPQ